MKNSAKAFALLLASLFLISLLMQQPAPASASTLRTIIVPDDFSSIKEAVDNAQAGDTVLVKPGTYYIPNYGRRIDLGMIIVYFGLTIDKPISFIGENCTLIWAPTVDPEPSNLAISIESDNVLISGFTIISKYRAINLSGKNITLTNNVIKTNSTHSDAVDVVGSATISSNVIEGGYRGIGIVSGEVTISNNSIRFFETGIEIGATSGNQRIFENTLANNSIGISCSNAPLLLYHNNIVNCSKYDIYLGKHGVYHATTVNVNATFNYWGTNDPSVIESMIYDGKNERNLGNVTFTPFLTLTPQLTPTPAQTTTQIQSTPNLSFEQIILLAVILILVVMAVLILYKVHKKNYRSNP